MDQVLAILLEGCKKNSRTSQKDLYQRFYNYGMTICTHYSRDLDEAKYLYNEAFYKVLTKLDRYDAAVPFRYWLRKIIVNTAIDYFRKYQKQTQTIDIVHIKEPNQQPVVYSKLSTDEILNMVQQLPPAYRTVFNLYTLEGLKHKEIAKQLGIKEGTSKSNYAKARMRLRKMIQNLKDPKKQANGG